MVHDREDARDLVQGALVKAYERMADYDPAHQFCSWVYRILVNDALNFMKKKRAVRLGTGWEIPALGSADDASLERERTDQVRWALGALSPEYREVLVL